MKSGVSAWNQWREENPEILPNLSGAYLRRAHLNAMDLRKADLSGADLWKADLSGANLDAADLKTANLYAAHLSGADLSGADLTGTSLIGANLSGANLTNADLKTANLCRTDLGEANLNSADLWGADLRGANLTKAMIGLTIFGRNDLSTTEGLNTVQHSGPSSIDVNTIFMSKGKIPYVFLRGAGVPEVLIEYLPSLLGTGIEFYSLFISYSTADEEFAKRLHADLQDRGVRCWFAPHDMKSGEKIHKQIDEAIRVYDRLLLILSPSSLKSSWVETEISKARKREVADRKQVLFPIRLCSYEALREWEIFDADTGKDTAREIREYFIPDFSNWKNHDDYQKALDGLVKDLNKRVEHS